jgi:hypothetical protein
LGEEEPSRRPLVLVDPLTYGRELRLKHTNPTDQPRPE